MDSSGGNISKLSFRKMSRNPRCFMRKSLMGVSDDGGSVYSNDSWTERDVVVTASRSVKAGNVVFLMFYTVLNKLNHF